jgi:futalosine hydrolase
VGVDLLVCVATEAEGALLRPRVEVLVTGVGAVNAAHSLTRFLERRGAAAILACGVGGAYPGTGLAVGDVLCAESEHYGDLGADSPAGFLDLRALGLPLIAGPDLGGPIGPLYNLLPMQLFPTARRAPFVTVNTATGRDAAARDIAARTGGAVESMEGAAIAHVAHLYGLPVGEVRGISNLAGDRDRSTWRVAEAARAAQEAVLAWLERR